MSGCSLIRNLNRMVTDFLAVVLLLTFPRLSNGSLGEHTVTSLLCVTRTTQGAEQTLGTRSLQVCSGGQCQDLISRKGQMAHGYVRIRETESVRKEKGNCFLKMFINKSYSDQT